MFQELRRFGRDPGTLRRTKNWQQAERWNEEAARAGRIDKVITCSLSDFFHEAADAWRPDAWELIRRCPSLHFQILSKRPLLIADRLPPDWGGGYPNVWLGVSIESNDYVWRADVLRQIPARVRWISAEPLLGPLPDLDLTGVHWIVVGGESGPGHRDMDHAWARQIRDMARAQGTAFYFKQSAGARAGQGDLLDGRRWREFPSVAELVQAEEPLRPEEEPIHVGGQEPPPVEQDKQSQELKRLQEELQRRQQEVEGLWAELEQQREEAKQEREDLEAQLAATRDIFREAFRGEEFWRNEAYKKEGEAAFLRLVVSGYEQMFSLGGSAPQAPPPAGPRPSDADLGVLGLRWPCTLEEVKKAYRALMLQHHPDRLGDPEMCKKVQAAYDRISEEFRRAGVQ